MDPKPAQLPNWRLNLVEEPPTSCWELFESASDVRRGRGIRASRDIAVHELIFRERCLLIAPTLAAGRVVCVVCFKSAEVSVCRCGLLLCGHDELCVRTHRWECAVILAWKRKPTVERDRTEPPNDNLLAILPAIRSLRLDVNETEMMSAMQAHEMSTTKGRCVVSAALALFNRPPTDETVARLKRAVAVLDTNAFETVICSRPTEKAPKSAGKSVRLCGLFALGGQLNHACTPNTRHAARISDDDGVTIEMSVYAAHAIRRGDEITTTYTSLLWDRTTRRTHLWLTKRFWCECNRCCAVDDDRVDAGLAALRCRSCPTGYLEPPPLLADHRQSAASEKAAWHCGVCCAQMEYSKVCQTQQIAAGILSRMTTADALCQQLAMHPILGRLLGEGNALLVEAKLRVCWSGKRVQPGLELLWYKKLILYYTCSKFQTPNRLSKPPSASRFSIYWSVWTQANVHFEVCCYVSCGSIAARPTTRMFSPTLREY